MDTMNDLLICAKAVGYDAIMDEYPSPHDESMIQVVRIKSDDPQGSYEEAFPYCIDYNPLTNDAQAMELLKWLIDRTGYVIELWNSKDGSWNIDTQGNNGYQTWSGQTLNEAIINAVCAMEDTHE